MNNERSAITVGNAWTRFWFTATPTTGMAALRIASGLLFLVWLLSFLGYQKEFFSLNGWFDEPAYREVMRHQRDNDRAVREGKAPPQNLAPAPIGWSMLYLAGNNDQTFQILYWASILVLVLFTLGIGTRITGVLTWIIVVSFLANPATSYEGDYLLGILAFYLMLGHLCTGVWNGSGHVLGLVFGPCDQMIFSRPRAEKRVSYAANFMVRLIQIHFTIIILTSAMHKLQISDWWSGVALWYPLHPPFQMTPEALQAEAPRAEAVLFWISLASYGVLAWQWTFPLFAWRQGALWRTVLLGGSVVGWLGSALLFKLPLFGPVFCIAALSFLSADEWAGIARRMQWLIGGAAEKAKATPSASHAITVKN